MMSKLFAAALTCAALANHAASADGLLGLSVPDSYAERTVVVTPSTTEVNVNRGDVVRFVAGDKSFCWSFASPTNISVVDLQAVAPASFFDHRVRAYIKRIPLYDGG